MLHGHGCKHHRSPGLLFPCLYPQAINQTVQKTLRQLKLDCATIQAVIEQRRQQDAAARVINSSRTSSGMLLVAGGLLISSLLLWVLASRAAAAVCTFGDAARYRAGSAGSAAAGGGLCSSQAVHALAGWDGALENSFKLVVGVLVTALCVLFGGARFVWRHQPVLDRRDMKRLDEYAAVVSRVAQQAEVLYEEYFRTLANAEER